ncbi:MAG: hypothetical protein JW782_06100 [Candidatus Saganbacteria bacterium]|nr:hypothetical protein [Candidatus Saganbacteria bacterium]
MRFAASLIALLLLAQPLLAEQLITDKLELSGSVDHPAVLTLDEAPVDLTKVGLKVIEVTQETDVLLPEGVEVVEYEPRTYMEKGFEDEINDYIFKGAFFYPALFVLAGIAYASSK